MTLKLWKHLYNVEKNREDCLIKNSEFTFEMNFLVLRLVLSIVFRLVLSIVQGIHIGHLWMCK